MDSGPKDDRLRARDQIQAMGIPTAFYHLDLWWSLARQDHLLTDPEPWVEYDFLFTADGGHQDEWASIGANHTWSPPGVYHAEAYDGIPSPAYTCEVAFVGAHRSYAHTEHWPVRQAMLRALRRRYGRRFRMFPERGPALRGAALNDLYASVKVVVGDSCLAGKIPRYWSDRTPETTGRGGFLIHPSVVGYAEAHPHVPTFPAGDHAAMLSLIDHFLAHPAERVAARLLASAHTRTHHTYRTRLAWVLDTIFGPGHTPDAEGGADGAKDLGDVISTR